MQTRLGGQPQIAELVLIRAIGQAYIGGRRSQVQKRRGHGSLTEDDSARRLTMLRGDANWLRKATALGANE